MHRCWIHELLTYKFCYVMTALLLTLSPACNYAKGKWVIDNNRPLYSGFGCKQWLSGMWACRLTQRTDFAYEKIRWQPKDCQVEEFEGSKFLRRYFILSIYNYKLTFFGNCVSLHFKWLMLYIMILNFLMPIDDRSIKND